MGANPNTTPSLLKELAEAGPCLHCSCCRGIFRVAADTTARSCYNCAVTNGIPLRTPGQILADGEPQSADLTAVGPIIEAIETIPVMLEAIRRGEGRPAKHEIRTWVVEHEFTSRPMRDAVRKWNGMVRFMLGTARRSSPPDIERIYDELKQGMVDVSRNMSATLLEFRAMTLVEDVGTLPETFRCPMALMASPRSEAL